MPFRTLALAAGYCGLAALPATADGNHATQSAASMEDAVTSEVNASHAAPFDIVAAHVHRSGRTITFHMTLAGEAGFETPEPAGQLGGATVLSYVWPTSLARPIHQA